MRKCGDAFGVPEYADEDHPGTGHSEGILRVIAHGFKFEHGHDVERQLVVVARVMECLVCGDYLLAGSLAPRESTYSSSNKPEVHLVMRRRLLFCIDVSGNKHKVFRY